MTNRTVAVMQDITDERNRQLRKWGVQNHPMPIWFAILLEELGETADDVLNNDLPHARVETVQTATVAVAMAESIHMQAVEGLPVRTLYENIDPDAAKWLVAAAAALGKVARGMLDADTKMQVQAVRALQDCLDKL